MTRRYETVYIFDSALDEPAITEKLTRLHTLFKIKKKDTGYYVVAQFDATGDLLPEYERAVKLDEGVLRYLVVQAAREQPKPVVAAVIAAPEEEEIEEEEA